MKKWLLPALLSALLLSGCGAPDAEDSHAEALEGQKRVVFSMDTVMNLSVFDEDPAVETAALDEAAAEIERLDALLSRHSEESAVSAINAGGGTAVPTSPELTELLRRGIYFSDVTDHALDLTVAPIMDLWDFTGKAPHVPTQAELDALLPLVNDDRIVFGEGTVALENGAQIDLGSIAKGYASARIAALFTELGLDSAMVNLGGNVYVHSTKPDGSPWNIAITDPLDQEAFLGSVRVADQFIITSAGYQRGFEQDGVRYYHIIDPKTGTVARSGLLSATIVCEDGTMGDALSTALFVMGLDRAVDFWKTFETPFDMVLMDEENRVYITEGLKDSFDPSVAEHGDQYEYIFLEKN